MRVIYSISILASSPRSGMAVGRSSAPTTFRNRVGGSFVLMPKHPQFERVRIAGHMAGNAEKYERGPRSRPQKARGNGKLKEVHDGGMR